MGVQIKSTTPPANTAERFVGGRSGNPCDDAGHVGKPIERFRFDGWKHFAVARQESPEIPWEDWEDRTRPQAAQETGMQGGANWSWEYYVRMLQEAPRLPRESTVDLEQY